MIQLLCYKTEQLLCYKTETKHKVYFLFMTRDKVKNILGINVNVLFTKDNCKQIAHYYCLMYKYRRCCFITQMIFLYEQMYMVIKFNVHTFMCMRILNVKQKRASIVISICMKVWISRKLQLLLGIVYIPEHPF